MTDNGLPPAAHNEPDDLDPKQERAQTITNTLAQNFIDRTERYDELAEGFERFRGVDFEVNSDERAGQVSDFIKQIRDEGKTSEAARKSEKAPYVEGAATVDAFFFRMTKSLKEMQTACTTMLTNYQREKERRERAERERLERIERERLAEEKRIADEAAAKVIEDENAGETELEQAVQAERVVETQETVVADAAKEASKSAADLSRTRGAGSVSSLVTNWEHDPESVSRNAIDLEALRPYFKAADIDKAIRGFITAMGADKLQELDKAGKVILRGARIYPKQTSRVA